MRDLLLDAAFFRQRAEHLCSTVSMRMAMGATRPRVRPMLSEAVQCLREEHRLLDRLHAEGFWEEQAQ